MRWHRKFPVGTLVRVSLPWTLENRLGLVVGYDIMGMNAREQALCVYMEGEVTNVPVRNCRQASKAYVKYALNQ